jgi:hypothetical protein
MTVFGAYFNDIQKSFIREREYRIEDCPPFYVNIFGNCGCLDSFPLDKAKIGFDTGKNRLLPEVDFDAPAVD